MCTGYMSSSRIASTDSSTDVAARRDFTSALRHLLRVLLQCLQHHADGCYLTPGVSYFLTLPRCRRQASVLASKRIQRRCQRAAGSFGVRSQQKKQLTDPEVAPLEFHHCLRQINHAADKGGLFFLQVLFSPLCSFLF